MTVLHQVAKDAYETGIEISLWCFDPPSLPWKEFDSSKFYERLLRMADDVSETDILGRIERAKNDSFEHKFHEVRRKEYSKRQMGSISLYLSSSLSIAVKMYKLLAPAKKPYPVWLVANSLRRTSTTTRYLNSNTAAPVDSSEISTYIDINGFKLDMTKAEMDMVKENAWINSTSGEESSIPAGEGFLKVLHFIDKSVFGTSYIQDYPIFIHPDESRIKGSVTLFTALLQDLEAKNLIGIALFARTKRSSPRLVVMLPLQEEREDGETELVGCNLIPLPFDGECRRSICSGIAYDLEDSSTSAVGLVESGNTNIHSAISSAECLIRKLQLGPNFDYRDLENPAIQNFYAVLQAVALSQSTTEWSIEDDMLQPSAELFYAASEEISNFYKTIGCDQSSSQTTGGKARKRAAVTEKDGTTGTSSKKSKADDGSFAKKTVAELKEMCKDLKLPVGGVKQVLIDRLEDHYAKH